MTSFTNPDVSYTVTPEYCECKSFQFGRGKPCKHIRTLIAETNKAQTFLMLKQVFDCRLNGDDDNHRCYYELSLGY